MIDLDITVLFQLINFLITLVVLNYLLIRPVREIIRQRQELVASTLGSAAELVKEADAKIHSYEATLLQVRAEAVSTLDAVRATAHGKEQQILTQATSTAQEYLAGARARVAAEAQSAREALQAQIKNFVGKAVAKVLD